MPALRGTGLAPLLAEDIATRLSALSVGCAALAVVLQMLLLMWVLQVSSLWREASGRILLAVAGLALVYFAVRASLPELPFVQHFIHLLIGFCGLLLMLKPVPGERQLEIRGR
jgi:hypothetical protein